MEQETVGLALRCHFEKTGPIRFISHLDLTRAFHRAFARADLPLKFSEGFSPHPKFSFALPLSVGTESQTELADFTLKPGFEISAEEVAEKLQAQMPAGIRIRNVKPQGDKFSQIAYASYEVTLPQADPNLGNEVALAAKEPMTVQKKNKKGKTVEKEISSGIHSLSARPCKSGLILDLVLSASGENYLKPELCLEALSSRLPALNITGARILRTGIFRQDLTLFV